LPRFSGERGVSAHAPLKGASGGFVSGFAVVVKRLDSPPPGVVGRSSSSSRGAGYRNRGDAGGSYMPAESLVTAPPPTRARPKSDGLFTREDFLLD
jgi:hypothetical protein